jgi:hypothetical protein
VHLKNKGKPLTREIAGKAVTPVLWFDFVKDGSNAPQIGLEYYLQASGRQSLHSSSLISRSEKGWNGFRYSECSFTVVLAL